MLFEEEKAEVNFALRIPCFSTYTDLEQTFTTEFPLKVNNFSSQWSLTLAPFAIENGLDGEDPINRDVRIILKCNSCNVNFPTIEVHSKVRGDEAHEKELLQARDKHLTWEGILITRLGLKVLRLLSDDQFTVNIRFVIKGSDMASAVGGVEGLSKDMRAMLERGAYSDADIITSDGTVLPVHMGILQQRSDFLQRIIVGKKRQLSCDTTPTRKTLKRQMGTPERDLRHLHEYLCHNKPETPINSTFGSISSGYQSVSPNSSLSDIPEQPTSIKVAHFSPMTGVSEMTMPGRENVQPPVKNSPVTTSPVLFRPRKPTPHRILQLPSRATSPHRLSLSVKKISVSPHSTRQVKNSPSSPRKTPLSNYTQSPKRIIGTPRRLSLTPGKISRRSLSRSSGREMRSTLRLSISKESLPVRSSLTSNGAAVKTPSPNKRLKTPITLSPKSSLSKVQKLRRTPLLNTPSPRRRLYQANKQYCNNADDFQPLDNSKTELSPRRSPLNVAGRKISPLVNLASSTIKGSPVKTSKPDFEEFEEHSQRPKIFVNMSSSVTRAILEWIYTGECSEIDRLSRALLAGGIRHGVTGLSRSCEYHLAAALTPVNAPEILFLAHKYSATVLQELTLDFSVKEAAAVTSQPVWSELAIRVPSLIGEYSRRLALHTKAVSQT